MRGTRSIGLGITAAAVLLAVALPGMAHGQTTWDVNTTADGFDQVCSPVPGGCTLREAVSLAASGDTVNLPAGPYVLSQGELGISVDLTILGAGARDTIISGNGTSKVAYIFDAQVAMSGVTLTRGNGDGEITGRGGAVYLDGGASLTLANSAVTASTITGDGGGIYSDGRLTLVATTVSGNTASGDGGGIYQANVELPGIFATSTISGNTAAGTGGGIHVVGPVSVASSTISHNAARLGGGLFKSAGSIGLSNTIVAALSGGACGGQITFVVGSHNLSDDASCRFSSPGDRPSVDPDLAPLADNGGPTNTHALLVGSPAIGAANPSPQLCTGTDQRGVARPQQGTCDIGAFEYVPPPPAPPPPPPSGSQPPPEDETQPLPPPRARKTVNALVKSGRVRVKLPGRKKYRKLAEDQQLPVGTTFDTRKGHVTLTAAANRKGKTATSEFWAGIFKVTQTKGKRPITVLKLVEKLSCRTAKKATTAKKKKKRRKRRRLWGNGKGRFRTHGKYSSATVRGTKWLVEDRCTRTRTRVVRGRVAVRDFAKKKRIIVRKGKKYVARRR